MDKKSDLTEAVEAETQAIGRQFWGQLERRMPSMFERRWWDDRVLSWAMSDESVKVQMFRFVDVLPMLKTHEQTSNRISFSIVLSALTIGSAPITPADIPPKVYGIPIIGALGFLAAGLMGFWLLVSILSHGKM